jgi:L-seryl-tRNA(Ser) seleniumtransferase
MTQRLLVVIGTPVDEFLGPSMTILPDSGSNANMQLPVWSMLDADPDDLVGRAAALAGRVGGQVGDGLSVGGGGAAPGHTIPSPVVRVPCDDADAVAERLRTGTPAVVVRVEDEQIVVDLRTVPPEADELVASSLAGALR